MKPDQKTIAELAAIIAAGERCEPRKAVRTALAIWMEAEALLDAFAKEPDDLNTFYSIEEHDYVAAGLAKTVAEFEEFAAQLPEGDEPISLEFFLRRFVDEKPGRSRPQFRKYLEWSIAQDREGTDNPMTRA